MHLLFFSLHPHPCWGLGFEGSESGFRCGVHETRIQHRQYTTMSINKHDVTAIADLRKRQGFVIDNDLQLTEMADSKRYINRESSNVIYPTSTWHFM